MLQNALQGLLKWTIRFDLFLSLWSFLCLLFVAIHALHREHYLLNIAFLKCHNLQNDWVNSIIGGTLSLIGHSAGGWLARVYMEEFGLSHISLLLTLGTPHLYVFEFINRFSCHLAIASLQFFYQIFPKKKKTNFSFSTIWRWIWLSSWKIPLNIFLPDHLQKACQGLLIKQGDFWII